MARFEVLDQDLATIGGDARADTLCEMGLRYAAGRDGRVDMVTAHKWFNIAAIKGSDRAAQLRRDVSASMSKTEIALALRQAREWMTVH